MRSGGICYQNPVGEGGMKYQCQICSYTGTFFPEGACPGCGSRKVKPLKAKTGDKPRARKPYMLALCVALWLYLVVLIVAKLI